MAFIRFQPVAHESKDVANIRHFNSEDLIELLNLAAVSCLPETNSAHMHSGEKVFEFFRGFFSESLLSEMGVSQNEDTHLYFTPIKNTLTLAVNGKYFLVAFSSEDRQRNEILIAILPKNGNTVYINAPHDQDILRSGALSTALNIFSNRRMMQLWNESLTEKLIPTKCVIYYPSLIHLGHYVMNQLGPSLIFAEKNQVKGNFFVVALTKDCCFMGKEYLQLLFRGLVDFRIFRNKQHVQMFAKNKNFALFSVGGCSVSRSLHKKTCEILQSRVDSKYNCIKSFTKYDFILGIGLRGGTRQCLNLSLLINSICEKFKNQGVNPLFLFDGMSDSPFKKKNSSTAMLDSDLEYKEYYKMNEILANYGHESIPLMGKNLEEQLLYLSYCNLIVGHQGSSSAKFTWLLGIPTVIHGPSAIAHNYLQRNRQDNAHSRLVGLNFLNAYRNNLTNEAPKEFLIDNDLIDKDGSSLLTRWDRSNYSIKAEKASEFILSTLSSDLGIMPKKTDGENNSLNHI